MSVTPPTDVPPPLPGPHGHDGPGPAGRAVRGTLEANAAGPARRTKLHPALDGGRPQPHGHLGPQARQREERRPVQADRHLRPRRQDLRAPADRRPADEAPEHHPLARLEGGQPRPRHLHDAHRLPPNPTVVHPSFGSVCSYELGDGSRTSTCPTASRSTRPAGGGLPGDGPLAVLGAEPERPDRQPPPPQGVDGHRMGRRLQMLGMVENNFLAQKPRRRRRRPQGGLRQDGPDDELAVHHAFKLDEEPEPVRDAYGKDSSARAA